MPMGTGAETLQHIPAAPYVTDPSAFFAQTVPNVLTPVATADTGPGTFDKHQLLQTGIVSKLRLVFDGQVVIAGGAATPSQLYPYNLLSDVRLSANGQNDLWSVRGTTLHALRMLRYPALADSTDVYPVGGPTVANGTYDLYLTWEIPIAMDDTSLVGSLYAQSSATNLTVRRQTALAADLFSTIPGSATVTGTWYLQETLFEIPFDADGRQIIPDLTRLHGMTEVAIAFTNTGDVLLPLIRSEGQLSRLLVRGQKSTNNPLSIDPATAASSSITTFRLQYGGNQRPLDYNPASLLQTQNNQHYGDPLPYSYFCVDLVRENPPRDVLLMQGVTELNAIPTVNSAVTPAAGAEFTIAQETLF